MARKETNKNLVALAVIFGLVGTLFLVIDSLSIPNKDKLSAVSGYVERLSFSKGPKSRAKVAIYLKDEQKRLVQDDITDDVPAIKSLEYGDHITALVKPDPLNSQIIIFWDIRRNGESILTYEQTVKSLKEWGERDQLFGGVLICISGLLMCLYLVRRSVFHYDQ